ncbi:MAG: methyltransferase domain-containing protein, partial [Verrucomicrobiota bacterium]
PPAPAMPADPTPTPPARPAFDRKAGCYDTHAHVQRDTAAWVAQWLPPAGEFASCLEFGAGTGNLTRHLAGRFARIEAGDLSPAMVARGREVLPATEWRRRDAWAPGDPEGAWDFSCSCSLLQWAPDPTRVLKNWRHILRPGGRHLSGVYIAPSLPEYGSLLPERRPFPWRTAAQWRGFFEAAGFNGVRLETRTVTYVYPRARALLRQLHGTGATLTGDPLPPGRLRRLLRDYDRVFGRPDGVPATWTYCRVEGTA